MAELRLTKIDDLLRRDHVHLRAGDECYFLREYTSGVGYEHSETNDLISNLKKSVDRRGTAEWKWKERATARVAAELKAAIRPAFLDVATLVPMPPSKSKTDPLYDDRMVRILGMLANLRPLDVRELLLQQASTAAAHTTQEARDPIALQRNYRVDESVATPTPGDIALFDDVITTGAHYRAASAVLSRRFPSARIIGIFVARRVFPTEDWWE